MYVCVKFFKNKFALYTKCSAFSSKNILPIHVKVVWSVYDNEQMAAIRDLNGIWQYKLQRVKRD